jgi:hypothetical protein
VHLRGPERSASLLFMAAWAGARHHLQKPSTALSDTKPDFSIVEDII